MQSWEKRYRKKAEATEPPHSLASQQADRAGMGKVETFPLASSSPPLLELSGHESVSRHGTTSSLSILPTVAQGDKEQRAGDAFSCQCPAETVLPGVRNSPVSPGNVRVSKAEILYSNKGTSSINNQCQQRNSKGSVPLQISKSAPMSLMTKYLPSFLMGITQKYI